MTAQAVTTIAPVPARDPFFALVERAATDPAFDPDKIDKLLVMWERTKQSAAEAEFNTAMAAAQSEMDPVRKDSDNPQTRSKYASYAAMDRAVRPVYTAHGFCLSFNTEDIPTAEEVRVICYVSRGGFTRKYQVEMPTDGKGLKGGDVMTKTHAMGSGITYGRRYLLAMIFNLATTDRGDDDGNAAGGKSYMGNPSARMAGGDADRVIETKSDNPVTPPDNAHTLPLKQGEHLGQWTERYIAAINACETPDGLRMLKEGNAVLLGKVLASTDERAGPFKERLRKATTEAAKRLAEARSTSAPAAGSAITNYTDLFDGLIGEIDAAKTEDALAAVMARITAMGRQIFPPDMDALMQRYRSRKEVLKP